MPPQTHLPLRLPLKRLPPLNPLSPLTPLNGNGILLTPFLSRPYAPNPPPTKPVVLEKPSKFNPPSHPARLKKPPRHYPGPPIMPAQREARKRRKYPSMMPPKGTFYYWFLNSRALHMTITLGTLLSLALFTFFADFLTTTPYRDLLPPNKDIYTHPVRYISRWLAIYKMHTDYITAVTAEKRRRKIDDVRKRAAYREAHGLEWEKNYFGWGGKGDGDEGEVGGDGGEGEGRQEARRWFRMW